MRTLLVYLCTRGILLKSSRSYAVHPACEKCHRLYPEVFSLPLNICEANWNTACCRSRLMNWKFLTVTRKGKVNLTVRSRVAVVEKRGVWAALGM